ncbi:polysaccharide lyase 6 family protein [Akkermansiaceae bacterium]|nr:polysaccharide lyase 6 family protein [Akkermansiaceae bacterium]MDB4429735.1 polysaccharide lyase 6 family protein [Akkermansiaceae bacterium]
MKSLSPLVQVGVKSKTIYMKLLVALSSFWLCLVQILHGAMHHAASAEDIEAIVESGKLSAGDTIVWADGVYADEELKLDGVHGAETKPIILRAATPGGVVLRGESRFSLGVKWWVIEGFHFDGGDGKSNSYNAVEFRSRKNVGAEHVRLTNCAMTNLVADDSSSKWILLYGWNNTIDHCHFSGKKSKGALITVELGYLKDDEKAGHRIAWNHFANFTFQKGTDNEVIRLGNSEDQHKPATCLVERNYFFRCDGENEIISNKSSFNTYLGNTFRKCNGALVLRHGHHARVEGNYFFGDGAKDAGGIRVSDSHHVIVNNYLQDLTGTTWNAAFSILGGKKTSGDTNSGYQAVDGITVAHNSIINCARSIFLNKAKGSRAPTGVMTNNLVVSNKAPLIVEELSSEKLEWIGNLFHGSEVKPELAAISSNPLLKMSDGLLRADPEGAAIDAAVDMSSIVENDIEGQVRPKIGKDIGADEVSGGEGKVLFPPLGPTDVGVSFLKGEGSVKNR